MDKSAASRKEGRSSTKWKSQETPAVADETFPILGVSGGLRFGNVRKALSGVSLENSSEEEMDSTSSSSLGLSSGEEDRTGREIRRRSPRPSNRPGKEELNRFVECLAAEANREIQEIERRRKGKAVETPGEAGTRHEAARQGANIQDLTETDVDEETAPPSWGDLMEEAVDTLIEVSAAQHGLAEGHKRQMMKVVDLIDRMISWRNGERQPSHPTSSGPRRRPRPTGTTDQPSSAQRGPSAAKKARHSGSHGGQRRN